MNRPRNRQPRPARDEQNSGPRRGGRGAGRGGFRQSATGSVPSTAQVVPGASVSIVLKADQPTGREVQGVVQDLLTRGNHPRGIKVRLKDGRVGRVQRMASTDTSTTNLAATGTTGVSRNAYQFSPSQRDARLDEEDFPDLPTRSLADYIPEIRTNDYEAGTNSSTSGINFSTAIAKCPMCEFEGDEAAVSHHVEGHFS